MNRSFSRNLWLLVIVAATAAGLLVLRDATKYEGTTGTGGSTRVEFTVDTRRYAHDRDQAATSLWYACVGEVSWDQMSPPSSTGGTAYVAALTPALATDAQRRFEGCLQDAKLDRVRGTVLAIAPVGADRS